jgi:lactoylglutathione lyase
VGAVGGDAFHPAVAQVEHIALATNDIERLCEFYQLLGAMASPVATDPGSGLRSRVLDFCGVGLKLFERPGRCEGVAGGGLAPGLMHLGFVLGSADAVDELSRVIAAAGHRVLERPHRAGELGHYESVVAPTNRVSSSCERPGSAEARGSLESPEVPPVRCGA